MIAFTKRNLKVFLRDKTSVFFSMMTVFIVIGLYVVFLGDVWTSDLGELPNAREVMDNWVMAGVLAITSVTTTMGILCNMVRDKESKVSKDFYVAPIKKAQLIGGYIASAYVIGLIMSLLAFTLAEVYIVIDGGSLISIGTLLQILALIVVVDFMNTAIIYFIVSFFQSISAFSTASTIVGTLIGFITGIYLPIGMYPSAVQWVIKCCPFSHAALLFRQVMMKESMNIAFEGVPTDTVLDVKKELGIVFEYGDYTVSFEQSLIIVVVCGLVFCGLALIFERRHEK